MSNKVTISLDIQTIQIIGQALQDGPFRVVAPILQDLQKQVDDALRISDDKDEKPGE